MRSPARDPLSGHRREGRSVQQSRTFFNGARNAKSTSESLLIEVSMSVLLSGTRALRLSIRPGLLRAASSFSTATTAYEETWHTREAALQDRLEDYKRPLTREEEGLRFQIKFVSNRDVSERDDAPEPRASS